MNRRTNGRCAALIAAAGKGERLGLGPKAFLKLGEETLLERAVAAIAAGVDEVIVAVPSTHLDEARALLPAARVVPGRDTRQGTVLAMLEQTDAQVVLVHDAARPFLPLRVVHELREAAAAKGAVSASRRVVDTLVNAGSGEPVDREALRAVQTPQGFWRDLLLQAHQEAARNGTEATDDTALVRALGHGIHWCEGSPWLFKITTPGDFEFARTLLPAWEAAQQ